MTDRVAPGAQGSTVRNMEYGEMGGAPAPFLVPFGETTRSTLRWSGLNDDLSQNATNPKKGPFGYNAFDADDTIDIEPGEGFVDGWFATDTASKVDLSPYQQEFVTVVVGWDPDAVYSSSVHANREDADSVIVALERNVADDVPYIPIFSGTVEATGSGGFRLDESDVSDLRPIGRPMDTFGIGQSTSLSGQQQETQGPATTFVRGNPTAFSGPAKTGPLTSKENAERGVYAKAPTTGSTGRVESLLTLIQSGLSPSLYLNRTIDGNGSAYNNKLEGAIGDFPVLNEYLSFRNLVATSVADLTYWDDPNLAAGFSTTVTGRPRRLEVSHDGTGSGTYGGVQNDAIVSSDAPAPFAITFENVSYTQNNTENRIIVGFTTADVGTDIRSSGESIFVRDEGGAVNVEYMSGGALQDSATIQGSSLDWTENYDITIGFTGDEVYATIDGGNYAEFNYSGSDGDFQPTMELEDDGGNASTETAQLGGVTVEPITETLQ